MNKEYEQRICTKNMNQVYKIKIMNQEYETRMWIKGIQWVNCPMFTVQ